MDSLKPTASQQALVNSVNANKNKKLAKPVAPETVESVKTVSARDGRDGLPGASGPQGADGEPGRDGVSPDINEIAALVPVAQDGVPGHDGKDGMPGHDGKDGMPGHDGKDGKSITAVEVDAQNNLIVAIDGDKRKVGTIQTQERAAFSGAGGGGTSGVYARKGSLIFKTDYVAGDTVNINTLVNDDGWLMSSNRKTADRAAVQRVGNEFNVYTGALVANSVSAKQLLFGTRYTSNDVASINGYRVDTVVGNEYSAYLVKDPLGSKIIIELITFTGVIVGFQTFNVTPIIIGPNETFDIIVLAREPDPTPTIVSINYDYNTPNNERDPNIGEIIHAGRLTESLYISKTDNDGGDRSVFLSSLLVGDLILGPNIKWVIQSVNDAGNYFNFGVSPTSQDTPDGVFNFGFETTTATAIPYGEDINFWNGSTVAQGLFIADGKYEDIIINDTAYGADLIVQDINKSDHWDVVMPAANTAGDASSTVNVRLESIGLFETPTDQLIPGLGAANLIRLHYGVGGATPGGEFNIVSDGTIACNTAGVQYHFGFNFRISRTGSSGESILLLRLMYAADGVAVNAIQLQNTFVVQIDNPKTIWRESFNFDFEPAQGSLMWVEAARDPAGDDSGNISTLQPSGDVVAWNPSQSAVLTIDRYITD